MAKISFASIEGAIPSILEGKDRSGQMVATNVQVFPLASGEMSLKPEKAEGYYKFQSQCMETKTFLVLEVYADSEEQAFERLESSKGFAYRFGYVNRNRANVFPARPVEDKPSNDVLKSSAEFSANKYGTGVVLDITEM